MLLTFHEDPKSPTKVISRAVRCDNRLFELHFERQQWSQPRSEQTYVSVTSLPTSKTMKVPISTPISGPNPMEIDSIRRRGPLTETEKQRCRVNRLCLYCGGLGHIAITCPHRPRHHVYQVLVLNWISILQIHLAILVALHLQIVLKYLAN